MGSGRRGSQEGARPENHLYVLVPLLLVLWTAQQATLDGLIWQLVGYSFAPLAIGLLFAKWRRTRSE